MGMCDIDLDIIGHDVVGKLLSLVQKRENESPVSNWQLVLQASFYDTGWEME